MSKPSMDVKTEELDDGQLDAVVGGSTALMISTNTVVGTSPRKVLGDRIDRIRDGLDTTAGAVASASPAVGPVGPVVGGDNIGVPGHSLV